jgi:hypothetical protein
MLVGVRAGADAQQGSKIEYNFKADEVLRYKLSMISSVGLQGLGQDATSVPVTLSGILRQQTQRILPCGDAEMLSSCESLKLDIMGQPSNFSAVDMPPLATTITSSGQVKKMESAGKLTSTTAGIVNQLVSLCALAAGVTLPGDPVKVGDKWSSDLTSSTMYTGKRQFNLAASDEKSATIKHSLTGEMSLADTPIGEQLSQMGKGKVSEDGTATFSTTLGHLLKSQATGTVEFPIVGTDSTKGTMAVKFDITLELAPQDTPSTGGKG